MLVDIPDDIIHQAEQAYFQLRNGDEVKTVEEHQLRILRTEMIQNSVSEKVMVLLIKASQERRKLL